MHQQIKTSFRRFNHALVDATRSFRRQLIRLVFGSPFLSPSERKDSAIEDILILRLDRKLGDSVASTGFLRELHKGFPSARLTVLTAPETAHIYRTFDFIEVIPVAKGIWPSLKTVRALASRTFDLLIDTSHILSPKVIHLAGVIHAGRKIAFKNHEYRLFSDHVDFDEEYDHITDRYRKTLELIGCHAHDLSYELRVPEQSRQKVDQTLTLLGDPPFIIINSFAGAQMRNLREQKTRELVQKLHERFPHHLLISIASPGDMRILEAWPVHTIPQWRVFPNLSEFYDNCRLVEKAGLVISVDTSIIHVASAFKTPVLGLYRAEIDRPRGRPLNWDPYGTQFAIAESKPDFSKPEQDINDIEFDANFLDKAEKLLRV